jgi:hypothetical protein
MASASVALFWSVSSTRRQKYKFSSNQFHQKKMPETHPEQRLHAIKPGLDGANEQAELADQIL